MSMDRIQVLVWFLMPIFALVLMLVLFGARGGFWIAIPFSLLILGIGVLYFLVLIAKHNQGKR